MGQHHSSGGILTVIGWSQQASKYGVQAHDLEVMAIHHAGWYLAWRAQTHDRKVDL
jgi:hypothetical protein